MSLTATRPEPAAETGDAGRNPRWGRDVAVAVNDYLRSCAGCSAHLPAHSEGKAAAHG